jgi:O-antigen/teichoic acid export membrane protein
MDSATYHSRLNKDTGLLRLLKDSLIYSLGGFAGHFIGVFLVPIFTRIFSPNDYGIIDLIGAVTTFLNLFLISGLDSATGRYYVDAEEDDDRKLTASTALYYLIALSFFTVLVLICFSKEVTTVVFGDSANSIFLTVALGAIPFSVLFASCHNLLKFRFQPVAYAATSILSLLIQISLTIYLVVYMRVGIIGIFIARLLTMFLSSGIGLWLTRDSYSRTFSFRRLKELLYFGMPLVPLSLAHYILTYSDRYFLKYFCGLNEVGLYGVGYRLASVISLLLFGFQKAWGPYVFSTYKGKQARRDFSKIYDYASIAVCVAFLLLSLFAKEIMLIFTTRDYVEAYKVVPFVAASIATYTFGGYFAFGIGIAKKNIHRAWGGAVAALINLGLNYVLIPPLGMIGAAIATIISFLVMGIILMYISQRYYRVEYRFKANFSMYLIAAAIVFFSYKLLPSGLTFESICLKLVLLIAFLVVPFILGLVSLKEIRSSIIYLKGM